MAIASVNDQDLTPYPFALWRPHFIIIQADAFIIETSMRTKLLPMEPPGRGLLWSRRWRLRGIAMRTFGARSVARSWIFCCCVAAVAMGLNSSAPMPLPLHARCMQRWKTFGSNDFMSFTQAASAIPCMQASKRSHLRICLPGDIDSKQWNSTLRQRKRLWKTAALRRCGDNFILIVGLAQKSRCDTATVNH
jgi:hypothetical protein